MDGIAVERNRRWERLGHPSLSCHSRRRIGTNSSHKCRRGCRWKDLRGRIEATPYEEEQEMVRNDGESNVVASISEVEHEWLNCPIDSFDHLLDDSLTEEQAEEIQKILERHRGLFSKKKA